MIQVHKLLNEPKWRKKPRNNHIKAQYTDPNEPVDILDKKYRKQDTTAEWKLVGIIIKRASIARFLCLWYEPDLINI